MHAVYLLVLLACATEAFVSRPPPPLLSSIQTRTTRVPTYLLPPAQGLIDAFVSSHPFQDQAVSSLLLSMDAPPETAGISYSKASYYTVLGLYLMSFPGIWSTISRSTKAKVKRKTYVSAGENAGSEKAMSLRQQAGEIMACESLCVVH